MFTFYHFPRENLLLSRCMRLLQHVASIYFLFLILLFRFSSSQENLCMIRHDSDLGYDIYNTINEHNRKQIHHLALILPTYFDIFLSNSKMSSTTSSASSFIMISMLILFECISCSSSLSSLEKTNLIVIVN